VALITFGTRLLTDSAPPLEPTQERCLTIRRVPKLPSHDASTMPHCILIQSGVPQIHVPAESINRLAAYTAKPLTQAVGWFSVRSRRRPERRCQSSLAVVLATRRPSSLSLLGKCTALRSSKSLGDRRSNASADRAAATSSSRLPTAIAPNYGVRRRVSSRGRIRRSHLCCTALAAKEIRMGHSGFTSGDTARDLFAGTLPR
jgi:hypothetical protein